ncbi:MAG: sodium-dependent transporter [Eubacteriaceae bacterium]|jgi:NSS family neurotransmitter:Na+ symporter|nr:sodium-dependent transporter [Eubacteriaceae bacterium]
MKNENFSSRIGFILVSAGCAIGLGNVWRFPFIVGKNGGALFVLIYLVFLVILGMPIMTAEFAVGRASQATAVQSFKILQKDPGQKWSVIGKMAVVGCYVLLSFYISVCGWMMAYIAKMASGQFAAANIDTGAIFGTMLSQPVTMLWWAFATLAITVTVCYIGFQKGVERITTVLMSLLFVVMIVLMVRSLSLPNAVEGLKFYLVPNVDNFMAIGWKTVVFEAMNQAFFTLSLGISCMAIFGSRIDQSRSLLGESIHIGLLDTTVAFMAGLIIFPAAASFGIDTDQGPSLIFVTIPKIFNQMSMGSLWGSLFFVFMSFAALSTVIAVFENIISCSMDIFSFSRRKSILINGAILLIISLPCILGFNVWSHIQPLGPGSTILDLEDFIVSANILPLGSLGYLLFAVTNKGWGFESFQKEANTGAGQKLPSWTKPYLRFVLPGLILFIFAMGYVAMFFQ